MEKTDIKRTELDLLDMAYKTSTITTKQFLKRKKKNKISKKARRKNR